MDYLDKLDFTGWRNAYNEMMCSYEDLVAEAEARYEYEKEEAQLKFLEERK